MSDIDIASIEKNLKETGIRAVNIEYYILRRTYGVYYSIWAAVFFIFISAPFIIIKYLTGINKILAFIAVFIFTGIIAFVATANIFNKAFKLISLKYTLKGIKVNKFRQVLLSLIFYIFMVILISISFSILSGAYIQLAVMEIFFIYIDIIIYISLKRSFIKIPLEGMIATYSYTAGIILGIALALVFRTEFYFAIAWLPTAICWMFSSIYGLYHSPDYLDAGDEYR
jgi:hypothetical protein